MKHSAHFPHVVYIITKLELGGAQKICLALMKEFSTQHGGASLISGTEGPLTEQAQRYSTTYLIPFLEREIHSWGILNEVRSFFSIVSLLKKIKKEHPSVVVHTHSTKAGILGRWAAWWAGIPKIVHTIHGYAFHDHQPRLIWWIIYLIEYVTSQITTLFICVSEKDRAAGVKLFPKFKQKNIIIRAAVEDHFFSVNIKKVSQKDNDYFTIGTISCLKPQKNLFDLLKAFKLILEQAPEATRRQLRLQIIGDGQLRNKLHAWVLRHQIAPHVVFLGWQSDTSSWMKKWDLFTLSSLWEGLPCSIIEARLHKLPVVAYNTGGIHDVIKNGKNGLLVTPGQWQDLANKISRCIYNKDLHSNLALFKDDLDNFCYESMYKKHEEIYQFWVPPAKEQQF